MIFTSPYGDVDIPDMPLTDFVLQNAAARGDKPALIDGPTGRTITYAQLVGYVHALAAGLHARGFRKGDVFATLAPNIPEYAVLFHGVSKVGGINTTMNPLYKVEEVVFQLKDSNAKYLITVPPFIETALEAANQVESVEEVFVFGEAEGATPFQALFAQAAPPEVDINPAEDLVSLPYSSGTTGYPKGVMLTHRNMVANLVQISDIEGMTEEDVAIGILPFFHIYGMEVILNLSVYNGATVVTMPRFDLELFLNIIQNHGVTRAHLVPPILLALAKHPLVDKFDLSSLNSITSGAAPLDAALGQAVAQRLGCVVKQGYGLTETSPVVTVNSDKTNREGTVGPLVHNTEVMIADLTTGEALETGQTGEVRVRGPQVMTGYLNNEDATSACFTDDGWFKTGDVGMMDDDHYLIIVDRVKEMIKYKGYQVAPAELEGLLIAHPSIVDAAVIPSPDAEAGEIPKAFVVVKEPVEADAVMAYIAEHVAPQKRIRAVEFVEEIPKSSSGKILRRVLIEEERG